MRARFAADQRACTATRQAQDAHHLVDGGLELRGRALVGLPRPAETGRSRRRRRGRRAAERVRDGMRRPCATARTRAAASGPAASAASRSSSSGTAAASRANSRTVKVDRRRDGASSATSRRWSRVIVRMRSGETRCCSVRSAGAMGRRVLGGHAEPGREPRGLGGHGGAPASPRVPALRTRTGSGARRARSSCSASGERQMLPVHTVRISNKRGLRGALGGNVGACPTTLATQPAKAARAGGTGERPAEAVSGGARHHSRRLAPGWRHRAVDGARGCSPPR